MTASSVKYQNSISLNSIFHFLTCNKSPVLSWTSLGVFKIANISVDSQII